MSGGEIHCGSFSGEDKSGSALEGVLKALAPQNTALLEAIRSQLDDQEYVLISATQATTLLPLLSTYDKKLAEEIGHRNWFQESEMEIKNGMDPVEAKWGASRGWRLYCTMNLIRACQESISEGEPVCITFS